MTLLDKRHLKSTPKYLDVSHFSVNVTAASDWIQVGRAYSLLRGFPGDSIKWKTGQGAAKSLYAQYKDVALCERCPTEFVADWGDASRVR